MPYDSRPDTYGHIRQVQRYLHRAIRALLTRDEAHDETKLIDPELSAYDEFTPRLAGLTYGSDEYKACLAALKPALEHHYACNPHHPEFHRDGIRGMSLVDLIEMLADWKAATLRHNDGDIRKSIEINQQRFGYSDELKQILLNTLVVLE